MDKEILKKSVEDFIFENENYYKQWVLEDPIIISNSHHLKLSNLHKVMYKMILHFVNNFDDYHDLMLVSKKTKKIVKSLKRIEYNIGTFRTDFVYDYNKQPKLIEITCRFALNTLFVTSIFDSLSTKYYKKHLRKRKVINHYKGLMPYISKLSKTGDIFILKGSDKKNESKIFKGIFEKTGVKVINVDVNKIEDHICDMNNNSWIISELTLDEIESININLIIKLSKLNIINDFRTSLLIHDKQFFSVLENESLQEACLTKDEINFFKFFLIPTYSRNQRLDKWLEAKKNKNDWILKHKALGKSKSIYAGIVTEQSKWDTIFENENLEEFVLQKWVPQTKIESKILEKKYQDYITGTMLFFNDKYFGLGPFRTSSFPVTNVVDDRKAISLVLKEDIKEDKNLFVNYVNS